MNGNIIIETFRNRLFFSCSVHVISSEKGNLVVDPGYYGHDVKKYIDKLGRVDAILLTHGHWDHIYGLQSLHEDRPEATIFLYEGQKEFLTSPYLNCSRDLVLDVEVTEVKEGLIVTCHY